MGAQLDNILDLLVGVATVAARGSSGEYVATTVARWLLECREELEEFLGARLSNDMATTRLTPAKLDLLLVLRVLSPSAGGYDVGGKEAWDVAEAAVALGAPLRGVPT